MQVAIKLPALAPMETKILASVAERAWIRVDNKASVLNSLPQCCLPYFQDRQQ